MVAANAILSRFVILFSSWMATVLQQQKQSLLFRNSSVFPLYLYEPQQRNGRAEAAAASSLFNAAVDHIRNNHHEEDTDSDTHTHLFVRRHAYWIVLVDDEASIRQAVGDYLYDSGYQVTACDSAAAFQNLITCISNNINNNGSGNNSQSSNAAAAATDTKIKDDEEQEEEEKEEEENKEKEVIPRGVSAFGIGPQRAKGRRCWPDAIISDIRMPNIDGLELVQWIRNHPFLKLNRLPVILLTAKGLTQDRILGYQVGADAYLTKPFAPEELLSLLDNCIARRQQLKGDQGRLVDLQQDMAEIKNILQQNVDQTVWKTNVYLTPAERETVRLLSQGYSNAEIAQQRRVATDRVVRTLQKLFRMTGVKSRTALVRWAIRTGYVPKR